VDWLELSTTWHDHPRTVGLSLAAKGLWAHGFSWCGKHDTGGAMPRGVVAGLGVRAQIAKLVAELVAAGLWEPTEAGWQFRDFGDRQRRAIEIAEARRLRDRERQAARRRSVASASAPSPRNVTPNVTPKSVTVTRSVARDSPATPPARAGGDTKTTDRDSSAPTGDKSPSGAASTPVVAEIVDLEPENWGARAAEIAAELDYRPTNGQIGRFAAACGKLAREKPRPLVLSALRSVIEGNGTPEAVEYAAVRLEREANGHPVAPVRGASGRLAAIDAWGRRPGVTA